MAKHIILLIDYEPRSIERIRKPLETSGYRVEVATDGVSGMEAFHRLSPDLVLVEAMIPKKHGFEVCQELKRTQHGARTPILITTGVYKGRKYRTQALHIYGCDEYLEKPIPPDLLLTVVSRFLDAQSPVAAKSAADEAADSAAPVAVAGTSRKGSRTVIVGEDLTEEEIMAKLNAILPESEGAASAHEPPKSPFAGADLDPLDGADAPRGDNPFAQMQAELSNELSSLSAALDLETPPVFEPASGPVAMPSDHAAPLELLETLPAPSETATLPVAEAPGQVVHFDSKRGKKKKSKHGRDAAQTKSASPEVHDDPASPIAIDLAPTAVPAGPVEVDRKVAAARKKPAAEIQAAPAKRTIPLWIWIIALVGTLIGVYFGFFYGSERGFSRTAADHQAPVAASIPPANIAPTVTSAPPPVDPAPPVTHPAASQEAPPITNPTTSQGSSARTASEPTPVTNPVAAPPPASKAVTAKPEPAPTHPPATHAERASASAANHALPPVQRFETSRAQHEPPHATSAETGVPETGVPGAAAPAAANRTAAGSLVPLEAVDTPPVSLSRRLPIYSLQARQLHVHGTVVVKLLINSKGTVDDVVLVYGIAGSDVNDAAVEAARHWTYRPAVKDGVPVSVWKTESLAFKL